jgi:hypothetical protein
VISETRTTISTAAIENAAAIPAFAARTRHLGIGRASRYRRLPHDASPATLSPAKIATASGNRNSSVALSAISGMVKPEVSLTTDPESPTRSAIVARLMAITSVSTAASTAKVARVTLPRGRRACFAYSSAMALT